MATNDNKISHQSRNLRLLCLRKIFLEETDAEHSITMPEILQYLRAYSIDADRRTIYEDIRVLQDYGKMDIEHEPGDHLYKLKSREFTVSELKLIVDSMASSKVLTPELTEDLTNKLAKLCSKHERDFLKKKIFLDGRVKSENKKVPSYIKVLNEGIIRQRWVAFRYYRYDVNKKKVYYYGGKHRRVRPAALLINNEAYYLLGYDRRDRRKLYRIDRMSHVSMHAERFQDLPEKLDAKMVQLSFSASNPFLWQRDITRIKIRFHNTKVDQVLDRFGFAIDESLLLVEGEEVNLLLTLLRQDDLHNRIAQEESVCNGLLASHPHDSVGFSHRGRCLALLDQRIDDQLHMFCAKILQLPFSDIRNDVPDDGRLVSSAR